MPAPKPKPQRAQNPVNPYLPPAAPSSSKPEPVCENLGGYAAPAQGYGDYGTLAGAIAAAYGAAEAQVAAAHPSKPPLQERAERANRLLASRFDALNKAYATVETHLKSLRPIREVWVAYNIVKEDPDGQVCSWENIGFAKLQEKWRLTHAYCSDAYEGGPVLFTRQTTTRGARIRRAAMQHYLLFSGDKRLSP
jgi:hypothetical protein